MKSTSKNSNLKATDNVKIALDKAESAFEKTKEWWKTLWKWLCEVVWWTSVAVVNLLKAGYEEWAVLLDKILEKNDPEKTTEKEQHKESAKNSWKKILKWWKSVLLWAKDSIKWTIQWIWNAIKSWYHLADVWDKSLWNKVEWSNIQNEKTKKVAKIWAWNLFKALYIWWLATALTFWWKWIVEKAQKDQDKNEEEKEVVITPEENENNNENTFIINPKKTEVQKDTTYEKEHWVTLLRDWKLIFYVVKKWEWLNIIKEKLSQIPEFSYLKDVPNWKSTKWFNTPNSSLTPWFYLPLPIKAEDREISIEAFKKEAKTALTEMTKNTMYKEKCNQLLKTVSEDDIISIMTAYARSETAEDWKHFNDKIWSVELHRREAKYSSYSFSYFHILMEKNSDGKTAWPWLKARLNLWLSEWDCYDVKNACKLFLGYCFEKNADPSYFFKIKSLEDAKIVWQKYNWSSSYWYKLRANVQYCKK